MYNESIIYEAPEASQFTAKGVGILLYSTCCYALGVAGLASFILAMAGLLPLGLFAVSESIWLASLINIVLLLLFGLQHSVMARKSFKQKFNALFPQAVERSTFVLASGLVLALTVVAWQPLPGEVWHSSGTLNILLWAGFAFGWVYLLAATFAINHFDLFGLRQAWLAAIGKPYTQVAFKEHWMYRYSRHPIMLGVIIGTWCVPHMTASMLMLAVGMTLYIAVGVYFEERDLIKQWGQRYLDYRQQVGALITLGVSKR